MAFDVGSAVGYLLLDVSGWSKGLSAAKTALKTFSDESATLTDKATALGSALTGIGTGLTTTVTAPLLGLGATAVKTAATFEQAMAQVQATLGVTKDAQSELNGETVNTMQALESLAKELGASTKFSASEAAAAINNMAMAGYSVQETYDALPTVLNLASAGMLDLDYATQLVANGLNVMGLGTESASELADKLAVTASNAYGSVSDFGEGLLVAGAQAKLANVDLTDTMTALGILGDNGISASEGGTYLRNTLKNLYTPTEDAAKALDELGVTTIDAYGNILDFQYVLQKLGGALDGLTEGERVQYMSRIFDTRTISAANALIENSGDRWNELADAIDNAGGAAETMAETQLNTLEGKLTIFKSALEGLQISFGQLILPIITNIVEGITSVVDWLNSLDESSRRIILTIAAVVAAIGPVLLIVGNLIKAIIAISTAIGGLKTTFAALNAVMLANPIVAITAAIAALVAGFIYLWNTSEGFRQFWIDLWNGVKQYVSDSVEAIKEKFNSLVNEVTQIPEKIKSVMESIIQWFSELPEKIAYSLGYIVGSIASWAENMQNTIATEVPKIIDSIAQWFSTLPERVWEWLTETINRVLEWGNNLIEQASSAMESFINGVVEWLSTLPDKFVEWFNAVIDFLKELPSTLYQIGADMFKGLWDGLKSVWDGIVNWIDGVINKIKSIFGAAQSGYADATSAAISGSYASGLDYVPRDMNVRVHEGERILTKQENEQQFGQQNSGPEVIQFELSIPMDGQVIAHQSYSYNLREGTLRGDDLVEGGSRL